MCDLMGLGAGVLQIDTWVSSLALGMKIYIPRFDCLNLVVMSIIEDQRVPENVSLLMQFS